MNKKGFTLVEILAVIVILGLVITITATKGFGAFDNTKIAITKENENAIKEAANVLMTEVKECDEEINKELIESFTSVGKKCSDLKEEASSSQCLDIRLDYLIDNDYITGNGAKDILDLYPEYSIKGCLKNENINIDLPTKEELEKELTNKLYVDQNNGNDSNDGSKSKPFKTLKKAYEIASSDELTYIYFLGDYKFEKDEILTNNKEITLTAINNSTKLEFNNENTKSYITNKNILNIKKINFDSGKGIIANDGTLNIDSVKVTNLNGRFVLILEKQRLKILI